MQPINQPTTAQTSAPQPQTNPVPPAAPPQTAQISHTELIAVLQRQVSEDASDLVMRAKKAFDAARDAKNTGTVRIKALNAEPAQLAFSAILIISDHGTESVVHTIILEASGQPIKPVLLPQDQFGQAEQYRVTGDVFTARYREVVRAAVREDLPSNTNVMLSEFTILFAETKEIEAVAPKLYSLAIDSNQQLWFSFRSKPNVTVPMLTRAQSIPQLKVNFNPSPLFDVQGMPIHTGISTELELVPSNSRDATNDPNQARPISLVNTEMFISLVPLRIQQDNPFMQPTQPQNNQPRLQAELTISGVSTSLTRSPMTYLMALLSAASLNGDASNRPWYNYYKPQLSERLRHRDLGILAMYFPELSAAKKRERVNIKDSTDPTLPSKILQYLVAPNLVYNVDVAPDGPWAWFEMLFLLEATGDDATKRQARQRLLQIFDAVLDNKYSAFYNAYVGNDPNKSQMFVWSGQEFRGFHSDKENKVHDNRAYGWLELSSVFEKSLNDVQEWDNTYIAGYKNEAHRLSERRQKMEKMYPLGYRITGRVHRLTITPSLMIPLIQAAEACNLRMRGSNALQVTEQVIGRSSEMYAATTMPSVTTNLFSGNTNSAPAQQAYTMSGNFWSM